MYLKTLLAVTAVLFIAQTTSAATDKIVCFLASWSYYRNGEGSFKPENINADLCTHIYYAFLGVDGTGKLQILDSWLEQDLGNLQNVRNLKTKNSDLKVLISIGGWNAGNALLNSVVASSVLRGNLIQSTLDFMDQYGYDGLDIDWEYPNNGDRTNFVTLLTEMRASFDLYGYILSVTVAGDPLSSYDIPSISKVADLINVMSYDYHTTDLGSTGYNAPLYGSPSINTSINAWLAGGAEPSKLTLSVPFYGHSFTTSGSHDVGAPASAGIAGPFTQSPGTLAYYEICEYYSDWTVVYDNVAQVPYAYDDTNWVSFDNAQSIGAKAAFAKSLKLAGVAIWSIDYDDFLGVCGETDVLLKAIKENID